jgi:hypothetical protein
MTKHPDGPIHVNRPMTCDDCQGEFIDDMYWYGNRRLCGECRYFRRTGKVAPREPTTAVSREITDKRYGGGYSSETLNRYRHIEAKSETHVRVLHQIESEKGD